MTADVSEFPAIANADKVVDQLDPHRPRQVCVFLAARYGWNLQPSAKKFATAASPNNRSEFAAIETATEELDQPTADQRRQAITRLATRYEWKIAADYKSAEWRIYAQAEIHKGVRQCPTVPKYLQE